MEQLTNKQIIEHFQELDYRKQRLLLTELRLELKPAPYFIRFNLEQPGQIKKMARIAIYCAKNHIVYETEKIKPGLIRFRFEGLCTRNETLIGAMCHD